MARRLTLSLALGLAFAASVSADPAPAGPTDEQLTERILSFNDLTTLDTMNAKLREINKEPDLAKRMAKLGAKMQATPGKSPLKFNAALVLGTAALAQRDYESGEALFGWCLEQAYKTRSTDRLGLTFMQYVRALQGRKKYAQIEEAAQRLLDTPRLGEGERSRQEFQGLQLTAIEQLIRAKSKQGDVDAALARVEQLLNLAPAGVGSVPLLELKAQVLRDAERFDDVADVYDEMRTRVKADEDETDDAKTRLDRFFRYMKSAAYVDAKKIDKAVAVLRELVKEDPENATYKNDLGFIMADHDRNLDEAEGLIREALKIDEEDRKKPAPASDDDDDAKETAKPNAAYLDSLGWVLYKKGKYEEALKHLLEASKDTTDGNHIEIWDHVADAQLALGKTADAIATWEKALKFEDVSPRDPARRKEIQAKLAKARKNPPVAKDRE